jgi:meprin B
MFRCWSYVGRAAFSKGYQDLSIGQRCDNVGTVMHEMMHAVGFWHAQSRPDRNQVVEIMWENIQEGRNIKQVLLHTGIMRTIFKMY